MPTIGPISIASSDDDVQIDGNPTLFLNGESGGTAFFGCYPDNYRYFAAFRFILPSAIPAGATITGATIDLVYLDSWSWDTSIDAMRIWAEDASNPSQVASSNDHPEIGGTPRTLTTASVRWPANGGLNPNRAAGEVFTTVDFASVIQELVTSYSGLAQNAAVTIWIARDSITGEGELAFADYYHDTYDPAALTISYTTTGSSSVSPSASNSPSVSPSASNSPSVSPSASSSPSPSPPDPIILKCRTAVSADTLSSALWSVNIDSFSSLGFVQLRVDAYHDEVLGTQNLGSSGILDKDVGFVTRFQAPISGSLSMANLYLAAAMSSRAKVAVYTSSAGSPQSGDALVAVSEEIAGNTIGWKQGSFNYESITSGNYYWILVMPDPNAANYWWASVGSAKWVYYKSLSGFYSSLPATLGTSWGAVYEIYPISAYVTLVD